MEIKVLTLQLCNGPKLPSAEIVARADLEIGGDLVIRNVALSVAEDNYSVLPPRKRTGDRPVVGWRKSSPFGKAINSAVTRVYFAMTGKMEG